MSGSRKKRGPRPIVDAAAKLAVLGALREGRRLEEVAEAYGVTTQAFYSARRRDALFQAAWRDAHSIGAEAERRLEKGQSQVTVPDACDERIVSNNRRVLQRRRMRHVRFDGKRQEAFLAHFAASCDSIAAAAEAGVSERTVYVHRLKDPGFAEAFQAALEQGYVRLEAEALRQRLEAQKVLRAAIESAEASDRTIPADSGAEFERVMKLLARWDRRGGRVGPREVGPGHERRMSFDEAIELLEKRLRALDVPVASDPAPDGEEGGWTEP